MTKITRYFLFQEEFETDEVFNHEVTKSYDVPLPLGQAKNKKIPHSNEDTEDHVYSLISSNPKLMELKDSEVSIPAGGKGKFQLKFAPVETAGERKFHLLVKLGEEVKECIEIKAIYGEEE